MKTKRMALTIAGVTLGLCMELRPATVTAQEPGQDRERASLLLGAFITDRNTSARLDSDRGPGTDLELEQDLGVEDSMTVFRLGGYYWVTPRQRLDFSVFDLSRDASRRIDETIDYGDATFAVDTVVNTSQDVMILKADYTFAPITWERGYLGITGGLYVAFIELSLSEATLGTAETEDITAPLPVIGFRGEYEINDRVTLRGAAQWFHLDTGDVDGRLRDVYIGADYGFNERMAVGLAYNDLSVSIEASETGGYEGELDWSYDGFLLYFKMDFGN